MCEFFNGWRRRAGCALLVMALGLAVLWLRSNIVADLIVFTTGDCNQGVLSFEGYILWRVLPHQGEPRHTWVTLSADETRFITALSETEESPSQGNRSEGALVLYYWLLIPPLTLLSAYLILYPGKRKAAQPTQNST